MLLFSIWLWNWKYATFFQMKPHEEIWNVTHFFHFLVYFLQIGPAIFLLCIRLKMLPCVKIVLKSMSSSHNNKCSSNSIISSLTKIHSQSLHFALSGALSLCLLFGVMVLLIIQTWLLFGAEIAEAATKAGVNKPELLPKEFSSVIDVAGFLSDGQVALFG